MGLALLALAGALVPSGVRAQSLADARRAYAEVDFEATVEASRGAIAAGGHGPAELAELYRLLGLSLAALEQPQPARDAFVRLLAVDPDARLENRLSPQLRSPYMEARGYWGQFGEERLAVVAALRGSQIAVDVTDPAGLAERVRVRHRPGPEGGWQIVELAPSDDPAVRIEGDRAEVLVELLDGPGNVLLRQGSEAEPERVGAWPDPAEAVDEAGPAVPPAEPPNATPLHVAGVALLAGGVASAVVGAVFHVERESLAETWNEAGPGCDGNGLTRGEVCAGVRSDLDTAAMLSGVFYGLGGALALAGAIVMIAAPSGGGDETALRCAPGVLSVACGGRF